MRVVFKMLSRIQEKLISSTILFPLLSYVQPAFRFGIDIVEFGRYFLQNDRV
jgi:hypothetical protein